MAAKSTRAAAADICLQLKKILALLKVYKKDHTVLVDAVKNLAGAISVQIAESGDLCLQVSSTALSQEGIALYAASRPEDSITRPLFLEGVKELWFLTGIDRTELTTLLAIWGASFERRADSVRSFITDCWEADLRFIRVVALETFSEKADGEDDESRKRQDELSRVISQMSSDVLTGQGARDSRRSIRISHLDLAVLTTRGVSAITAEDLERRDRQRRIVVRDPPEAARQELLSELSRPMDQVFVRGFLNFADVPDPGDAAAAQDIGEVVRHLLTFVAKNGRTDELIHIARARAAGGRSIAGDAVAPAIASAEVLDALVPMLATESAEAARTALVLCAPEAAGALLDRLAGCASPAARRHLAECVSALKPTPEVIAERIPAATAETVESFLAVARSLGEPGFAFVRRAGLGAPDPAARRAFVATMSKQDILADRDVLYPLLSDADAQMRGILLHALVAAKDQGAVPALERLLSSGIVEEAERRAVLAALGVIGGGGASAILRREIQVEKDPEQLAAAIRALARSDGETARAAIEAVQKRWFVRGQVKAACEEALKRIGLHPAGGGSDGSSPAVLVAAVRTPSMPSGPASPSGVSPEAGSGPGRKFGGEQDVRRDTSAPAPPGRSASAPGPRAISSPSTPAATDPRPLRAPSTPGAPGASNAPSGPLRLPSTPRGRSASTPPEPSRSAKIVFEEPVVEPLRPGEGILSAVRHDRARLETDKPLAKGARIAVTISSADGANLTFEAGVAGESAHGTADIEIDPLPGNSRAILERTTRSAPKISVHWKTLDPLDSFLRAYIDDDEGAG